jgi:hypothetical protein
MVQYTLFLDFSHYFMLQKEHKVSVFKSKHVDVSTTLYLSEGGNVNHWTKAVQIYV